MAGMESGINGKFYVSADDQSPTWVLLGGQSSATLQMSTTGVDRSDKSSRQRKTAPGQIAYSITVDGKPVWPDTTGLEVVLAAVRAADTVYGKFVVNSQGNNYIAHWTLTGGSLPSPTADDTSYSLTFEPSDDVVYAATDS